MGECRSEGTGDGLRCPQPIESLFEEEQLSPNEYYEMMNKSQKKTRKRAAGKLKVNKEESEW